MPRWRVGRSVVSYCMSSTPFLFVYLFLVLSIDVVSSLEFASPTATRLYVYLMLFDVCSHNYSPEKKTINFFSQQNKTDETKWNEKKSLIQTDPKLHGINVCLCCMALCTHTLRRLSLTRSYYPTGDWCCMATGYTVSNKKFIEFLFFGGFC